VARRRAAEKDGERRSALAAVSDRFKKFRPASQVLSLVRAVPTRFPQFDHATRVGGLPVERFMLLHGPSNEGKSMFALGLCDSFLARDHFALYIDAERTTPGDWVESLLGTNARHPGFFGIRPDSYEETIAQVRDFLNTVRELREGKKVPSETGAIVVVDSLRKLVPKGLLDEILRYERESGEDRRGRTRKGSKLPTAGNDRGAQLKAKMNAAWMDEVVPLLEHARAGMVAIAREMVDPDADAMSRRFGTDYKVGGGGAIYYDSSLAMRVERARWVTKGEGEEERKEVYGERHRVTIKKTKVGNKEGRVTTCFFHSSNGRLIRPGFDLARDLIELGERFDVVKRKGAWLQWEGRRWQGVNTAVEKLTADPQVLAALDRRVRAQFERQPAAEHTADGEVLEER